MRKKYSNDPFKQSDRKNPIGGGKGDCPRVSDWKRYHENFPAGFGPKKAHAGANAPDRK